MTAQDNISSTTPLWIESERLSVLARYGILDTAPEPQFDGAALLASQICETPIALITLIDEKRQWFKAKVGIDIDETALDLSVCVHGICETDLFIIPDLQQDERFKNNPLTQGAQALRFYAGAQINSREGLPLGMVCVVDTKPRVLNDMQKSTLRLLAQQVMRFLEFRESYETQTKVIEFLRANDERQQTALYCSGIGTFDWDMINNRLFGDAHYAKLINVSPEQAGSGFPVEAFIDHIYEEDRLRIRENLKTVIKNRNELYSIEYRIVNPDGSLKWICSRARCQYTHDKKPRRIIGCSYELERHRMRDMSILDK